MTFSAKTANSNLHVYTVGSAQTERNLIFRDWLRTHPLDRDLYARTKRALARRTWRYVQNYADAKSKIVEDIIPRARTARQS